ncbi:MAG TPA: methyltransferase, partial [Mycobacterium sp.]|nr:methyltransferase [Mycobacterium sp.]
ADVGADATTLTRLLRALAALGVLTETQPGSFKLTGLGALLRSDRPDSMRSFVQMFNDPAMLGAWRELDHAVRTGETTFDRVHGTTFFGYLAERPELSAQFNAAMRQGTALTAQQLPTAYDFSRFRTVADIGGGDGTLLSAVLAAHPHLHGILFDTAEGLAQADDTFKTVGVIDRCATSVGDFFSGAPAGAALYMIKSVLHDWDDERCRTILGHVRAVIPDDGRLLIIEPVFPPKVDGTQPPTMYLSDLNMLVNLGGRERTRAEFEQLCSDTGFRLTSVTPLPPPAAFSLLEAEPVR